MLSCSARRGGDVDNGTRRFSRERIPAATALPEPRSSTPRLRLRLLGAWQLDAWPAVHGLDAAAALALAEVCAPQRGDVAMAATGNLTRLAEQAMAERDFTLVAEKLWATNRARW